MMKKKYGIHSDGGDIIKKNRKRSRLQEDRLADSLCGKKTPNSGAASIKGDIILEDFRIECKNCEKQSFVVKLSEFLKIEKEALDAGKMPALIFSFDKIRMPEDLVIIREKDFKKLLRKSDENTCD